MDKGTQTDRLAIRTNDAPATGGRALTLAGGLVRTARPRQWLKNILVFIAPLADGILGHDDVWGRLFATFCVFCLLSSGGYFVNDVLDVSRDRQHPTKRRRPIAAGVVPTSLAVAVAVALFAAGFAIAATLNTRVLLIAVAYVVLTVTYSWRFKHEPVAEMVLLATAFVLRAAAGGEAVGVHLSPWFTVVVSFGALSVVAGKRYAEQIASTDRSGRARQVLAQYPPGFLRFVWILSATITVTGYCLWALLPGKGATIPTPWPEISIAPFLIGILRYGMLLDAGAGEAPEDVFIKDRMLQLSGVVWAAIYVVGLYAL